MKIVDAAQMRNIDRRAVERFGIPSIVLMENAAIAVLQTIRDRYPDAGQIAIFCGPGQNGGDGLALARHLHEHHFTPHIALLSPSRVTGDAETNLRICREMRLRIVDVDGSDAVDSALALALDADVIVDAIFGTGLSRPPEGIYAEIIEGLASMHAPVVAVDVPSGIDASSANLPDRVVRADVTVTFACPKVAHIFTPAADACGDVVIAGISIPQAAVAEENVLLSLTTSEEVAAFIRPRERESHKGSYGHVAVVAGSPGRSGAAVLTARGALRSGAGLVTVFTDVETAKIIDAVSIESMSRALTHRTESVAEATAQLAGFQSLVVGPGLADDDESYAFVRELLQKIELPVVLDASGLNAFAAAAADIASGRSLRILTPHPGELARLLGTSVAEVQANRIAAARHAARVTRSVVVLKGQQSLIAEPEGNVIVNPTGNPGMATGGMGDVLAGMIGALLARDVAPVDAAQTAVYIHGFAADLMLRRGSDIGMTALDVADAIPQAIRELRGAA